MLFRLKCGPTRTQKRALGQRPESPTATRSVLVSSDDVNVRIGEVCTVLKMCEGDFRSRAAAVGIVIQRVGGGIEGEELRTVRGISAGVGDEGAARQGARRQATKRTAEEFDHIALSRAEIDNVIEAVRRHQHPEMIGAGAAS